MTEKQGVMAAALLAAFADGSHVDAEHHQVRRVVDSLGGDLNALRLYREVLFKRLKVAHVVAALKTPATKLAAYEIAVGVCDSDALRNEAETRFLAELGRALGLGLPAIAETAAMADALATMPLASTNDSAQGDDAHLEQSILDSAILAASFELLPQSTASLAVIPLQMKMVYRIGQAHGQTLDRKQITEFLATLGIGLTGQYIDQLARKLGGPAQGPVIARPAANACALFATTYALGATARRYYAGARALSPSLLQQTFNDLKEQGKKMQSQYLAKIEETAQALDLTQVASLLREH